jgi:hypothetical protein
MNDRIKTSNVKSVNELDSLSFVSTSEIIELVSTFASLKSAIHVPVENA